MSLPAGSMAPISGAPSLSGVGLWHSCWLLDSASDERVAGRVVIPTGWSSVDVDIRASQTNGETTNLNVRWNLYMRPVTDGTDISGVPSISGLVTQTLPGTDDTADDVRALTGQAVTAGQEYEIIVSRDADSVLDTYPADVALLSVLLS